MSYLLPTRLPFTGHLPDGLAPPGDAGLLTAADVAPPQPAQETGTGNLEAADRAAAHLTAEDLEQLSQEQYNLQESEALSLGYSVATLTTEGSHDLLIFQAARYKDIDIQGQTYRFGVAVEATITVATAKFQGALTLPVVAANVQLSFAAASSTLAVRGYLPQAPLQLPAWGSFDVGSYADFQATVSKLQDTTLFDNSNIRPVLLASTQPPANPQVEPRHTFLYAVGARIDDLAKHMEQHGSQ
jgi:hypothetical protein